MKNKELIEKLKALPPDIEVCIFDYKENERHVDDWKSSGGIYDKFNVYQCSDEDIQEGSKPWIALEFANKYLDETNQ